MIPAPTLLTEVLNGLIARSHSGVLEISHDQTTLITIILLLICEMITGGENFSLIYGVFKSFTRVSGGELKFDKSQLGEFLKLQTRR